MISNDIYFDFNGNNGIRVKFAFVVVVVSAAAAVGGGV